MTRGMKRKNHTVDRKSFIPVLSGDVYISEPVFNNRYVEMMCDVVFMSPAGMVGMTMRDDRIVYGPPRVEINVGLAAINPFVIESQKRRFHFFSLSLKLQLQGFIRKQFVRSLTFV